MNKNAYIYIYIYDGFFSIVTSLVSRTLHVARARTLSGLLAVFPIPSIHRAQQCPVKVSSGPTLKIRDPAPRCAINNRASLQPRITPAASVIVLREPLPFTCYRSLITSLAITTAYYRETPRSVTHPNTNSYFARLLHSYPISTRLPSYL